MAEAHSKDGGNKLKLEAELSQLRLRLEERDTALKEAEAKLSCDRKEVVA